MPGALEAVKLCRSLGIKTAIASSSMMRIIEGAIDRLDLGRYFDFVHSGEYENFGKPHPGIFMHVAEKMEAKASECLVFEDSLNGIIAAKAARMQVIGVPEPKNINNPKYQIADIIMPSLLEFNQEMLQT